MLRRTDNMLPETDHRRDHVKTKTFRFLLAFIIGSAASPLMGQKQYSVHDLGTLGGSSASQPKGINGAGQVVGYAFINSSRFVNHAFRTAANRPINPATDDLGTLGGEFSSANGINSSGEVVGDSLIDRSGSFFYHAFRTAASRPINPATDDLRTLGGDSSSASGINDSGQVVGSSLITGNTATHAFRTSANRPINLATDDLGTLGGNFSSAVGINGTGQVVGFSTTSSGATHAFRTAANRPINPATDDLGSLGANSLATAVSTSGQVVGYSFMSSANRFYYHAFRTAASGPINPAADDLGAVGPASVASSRATGINSSGQVVGYSQTNTGAIHAFLYSSGVMDDLNDLIPANSGWVLQVAYGINNAGQIIGCGIHNGQSQAFRLDPRNRPNVNPNLSTN